MVRAPLLSVLAMAAAVTGWAVAAGDGDLAGRCRALAAAADPLAVAACGDALSAEPDSAELQETLAVVELRHGDPEHALTLWQSLLVTEGWSRERAQGEAMALWRTGGTAEAEAALRELARRDPPSVAAREDLIRFLLTFYPALGKIGCSRSDDSTCATGYDSQSQRFPDRPGQDRFEHLPRHEREPPLSPSHCVSEQLPLPRQTRQKVPGHPDPVLEGIFGAANQKLHAVPAQLPTVALQESVDAFEYLRDARSNP